MNNQNENAVSSITDEIHSSSNNPYNYGPEEQSANDENTISSTSSNDAAQRDSTH